MRVAAGEPLPLTQTEVPTRGHAIEARVYAEDPDRGFPAVDRGSDICAAGRRTAEVRVDTGVRQGDAITPYYDPMIAKLIVWGPDRETPRAGWPRVGGYEIVGVTTNGAAAGIAESPAFLAADLDTGFIARHIVTESFSSFPAPAMTAAAALAVARPVTLATDPWEVADAFRLNGEGEHVVTLRCGEVDMVVRASGSVPACIDCALTVMR